MSQLDPSMGLLMAANSLARNTMQPTLDDSNPMAQAPVVSYANAEYQKRKNGISPTARPVTGGYGNAQLAPHVQQQAGVHQQTLQQQAATAAMDQGSPAAMQANAAAPNPEIAAMNHDKAQLEHLRQQAQAKFGQAAPTGFNPATGLTGGQTLGQQDDGSRNVELIRGGQSEVQHFNAQGDNTGVLPAANSAQAGALPKAMGYDADQTARFNVMVANGFKPQQAMAEIDKLSGVKTKADAAGQHADDAFEKENYSDLLHQYNHLQTQRDNSYGDKKKSFQSQMDDIRGQMTAIQKQRQDRRHPLNLAKTPDQMMQGTPHDPNHLPPDLMQGTYHDPNAPHVPPPPASGAPIPPDLAKQIYQAAGGDPEKTKQLILRAGWAIPSSQPQYPDRNTPDKRGVFQKASDLVTGILSAG